MEKKSVSATFLVIFLALTFSVIGICFSVYVYQDTKIVIENITISTTGISVYSDKDLQNSATSLNLSNMDLGLKPATGELDSETQIPSTITDEGTSEGYYATIYVPAGVNFKITITNVVIDTKENEIEANNERKNIFISIKDIENSTQSIEEEVTEIATFSNVTETQKLTFLIWLGSLAGDELVGSKISFTLNFEAI